MILFTLRSAKTERTTDRFEDLLEVIATIKETLMSTERERESEKLLTLFTSRVRFQRTFSPGKKEEIIRNIFHRSRFEEIENWINCFSLFNKITLVEVLCILCILSIVN